MQSKDHISVTGPKGFGYTGSIENCEKATNTILWASLSFIGGLTASGIVSDVADFFFGNKKDENNHRRKMEEQELAHKRKMEEEAQKSAIKKQEMAFEHEYEMQEATHKSNLKKEEMNLEQEHWRERHPQKDEPVAESETSAEDEEADEEFEAQPSWLERFMGRFKMPDLLGFLKTVMAICPSGYEPAMLLHVLSMFAALCFSKVRAKYLDGKKHAPNVQLVVEGGWGNGKAKFEDMYNLLFARIIDADVEKMNCIDPEDEVHPVVQTVGLGLTRAKYFEVLSATKGLHLYNFSPEILAVINDLKKQNGLTFEHLRKAFDNSTVYQNTMKNKSKNGFFPVYYNYTFTGTPNDVSKFISGELEGGTASRIGWGVIPETGKEIPRLGTIAEPELEKIHDQIDDWKSKYCYQTIGGEDIIQSETVIDLDYVNEALKKWLDEQFELSEQEKNPARANARTRMAAIAFHAAIVIAMMYGNPSAKEHAKRKAVVELVIYIANLCMERFLYKFGDIQNAQRAEALKAEKAKTETFETSSNAAEDEITDETVAEWYRLNTREKDRLGYKKIAKEYNIPLDTVKNRLRQYRIKNSI